MVYASQLNPVEKLGPDLKKTICRKGLFLNLDDCLNTLLENLTNLVPYGFMVLCHCRFVVLESEPDIKNSPPDEPGKQTGIGKIADPLSKNGAIPELPRFRLVPGQDIFPELPAPEVPHSSLLKIVSCSSVLSIKGWVRCRL